MATWRELLVGNIAEAKENVAKLEAYLARMDAEDEGWLDREVHELQTWLQGLAAHVFSKGPVAAPPAPVATAAPVPVAPAATVTDESGAQVPVTVVSASAAMVGTGQLGGPADGPAPVAATPAAGV